jgi:hypothetical protein
VIRHDRLLISRKPYAFDLSTLTVKQSPQGDRFYLRGSVDAVWFRKREGVVRACLGPLRLWGQYLPEPVDITDPLAVLAADLDGRYGGDTQGRWDGEGYWGAQKPAVMEQHLAILQPMLSNLPALPDGYSGWWTFQS